MLVFNLFGKTTCPVGKKRGRWSRRRIQRIRWTEKCTVRCRWVFFLTKMPEDLLPNNMLPASLYEELVCLLMPSMVAPKCVWRAVWCTPVANSYTSNSNSLVVTWLLARSECSSMHVCSYASPRNSVNGRVKGPGHGYLEEISRHFCKGGKFPQTVFWMSNAQILLFPTN